MRFVEDADGNRRQINDINVCLWPQIQKHGLYCTQCSMYMKLFPISHDLPPTHWHCHNCKKNITITERDRVFEVCVKLAKEKCDLKTLDYSKQDRSWTIESSEFIGDSRINAKRKVIGPTERSEIIGKIQDVIQEDLHVSFENFQEYFNEG